MSIRPETLVVSVLAFVFFGFTPHKFYVSNTVVKYSKDDKTLQMTSLIFTDDFEKALNRIYRDSSYLATKKETVRVKEFIRDYMKGHLKLFADDKRVDVNYIGKKHSASNLTKCFMESVPIEINDIHNLAIENTILVDDFPEQQNIVTVSIYGEEDKVTAYLTKSKPELSIDIKK